MSRGEYDRDDDYGRRKEPHRGTLILILGVLGLMACQILGIAAWVMGSSDLQAMKAGRMDPEGQSMTQIGHVLGIVSTVLLVLQLLLVCVYFVFVGAVISNQPR